jgi:hypothetical protein
MRLGQRALQACHQRTQQYPCGLQTLGNEDSRQNATANCVDSKVYPFGRNSCHNRIEIIGQLSNKANI